MSNEPLFESHCQRCGETVAPVSEGVPWCHACGAVQIRRRAIDPLTESQRVAEELPDWTPLRCPKCGGPLVATTERTARWYCRACVLLVKPMADTLD